MHEPVSHTEAMATVLMVGMTNPIILCLWIVLNFLVSSVSGSVHNRGSGIFDSLSKYTRSLKQQLHGASTENHQGPTTN